MIIGRQPKFRVGQRVRHRASKAEAVVTKILTNDHAPVREERFYGCYLLSLGFGESTYSDEDVLEECVERERMKGNE